MTTNPKNNKTLLGSLGVLGVLAVKFKVYIFAALKALSFLKIGWLISPIISIGFYALLFGWPYAIAIMVLLFVHEMGHYIWMKVLGLNPKLPIFIPGVGAYVAMQNMPGDQATHAWVALAGPLVGGVGCAALFWIGVQIQNGWCLAAGSTGFFLNLLQLIPAKPLDGGFIIQAVSRWLLIPGVFVLLGAAFMLHSPLLLIISGISIFSLVNQFMHRKESTGYSTPGIGSKASTMGDFPQGASGASLGNSNPAGDGLGSTAGPVAGDISGNVVGGASATRSPGSFQSADRKITTIFDQAPATVPQRITIAAAYLALTGMLAYLHWMCTNELITFIPQK